MSCELYTGLELTESPLILDLLQNIQQMIFFSKEENLQLRTQLQELEKRVSDLTATNEFLLDQNAQLRLGVKPVSGPGSGSASVAGVTVGPVGAGVVAVSGLGGPSSSYCY